MSKEFFTVAMLDYEDVDIGVFKKLFSSVEDARNAVLEDAKQMLGDWEEVPTPEEGELRDDGHEMIFAETFHYYISKVELPGGGS